MFSATSVKNSLRMSCVRRKDGIQNTEGCTSTNGALMDAVLKSAAGMTRPWINARGDNMELEEFWKGEAGKASGGLSRTTQTRNLHLQLSMDKTGLCGLYDAEGPRLGNPSDRKVRFGATIWSCLDSVVKGGVHKQNV